MKSIATTCALMTFLTAGAVPTATIVSETQDESDRSLAISYTLTGEDGIVTVDFQTNTLADASGDWVSIGGVNFTNVTGDVNRGLAMTTGSTKYSIVWRTRETWPDHKVPAGCFRTVLKAWAFNAPPKWMDVDLTQWSSLAPYANIRYFEDDAFLGPLGATNPVYKQEHMLFRRIPAAGKVFVMGADKVELNDMTSFNATTVEKAERTAHPVMLTSDFYMAVYELTNYQFYNIMKDLAHCPSGGERLPVQWKRWVDFRGTTDGALWPAYKADGTFDYETSHKVDDGTFVQKFRAKTGLGLADLPTEAQWEFAARGGSSLSMSGVRANRTDVKKYSRCWDNCSSADCEGKVPSSSSGSQATVGSYLPNGYGLYDTIGNFSELTLDYYEDWSRCVATGEPIDANRVLVDPVGPTLAEVTAAEETAVHTCKGGSWSETFDNYRYMLKMMVSERSTRTSTSKSTMGMRLAIHFR